MFKHLHIVACSPRSGTTLFHEAMVTCFRVDKFYDHEIRFNLVSANTDQLLVTKRPKDTMYMPAVIDKDPELYVVYLLRDPRDVIVSRHAKNKEIYYSNIRLWRQMHHCARAMFDHPRFLQIRYEDFVSQPDAVQSQIAAAFPWLQKTHNFSAYHEYAEVSDKSKTAMHSVRPIAPTSVGVWRKHLGRVKGQQILHGSLTPDLVDCGYETSDKWERELEAVPPDFSPSHYPENDYFWTRISQHINALRKVAMYKRMRRKNDSQSQE